MDLAVGIARKHRDAAAAAAAIFVLLREKEARPGTGYRGSVDQPPLAPSRKHRPTPALRLYFKQLPRGRLHPSKALLVDQLFRCAMKSISFYPWNV